MPNNKADRPQRGERVTATQRTASERKRRTATQRARRSSETSLAPTDRAKFSIARMSKINGRDERRSAPELLTMLEEVQEAVLIFSEDIQSVEFPL